MFAVFGYVNGASYTIKVKKRFATESEARAEFNSLKLPKSCKAFVQKVSGVDEYAYVGLTVHHKTQDRTQGTRNETGINRLKALLRRVSWEWMEAYAKNAMSREYLENLLKG